MSRSYKPCNMSQLCAPPLQDQIIVTRILCIQVGESERRRQGARARRAFSTHYACVYFSDYSCVLLFAPLFATLKGFVACGTLFMATLCPYGRLLGLISRLFGHILLCGLRGTTLQCTFPLVLNGVQFMYMRSLRFRMGLPGHVFDPAMVQIPSAFIAASYPRVCWSTTLLASK